MEPGAESPEKLPLTARIRAFLFKNQTARQTVAKNTFWLSVTNFGGRILRAVIVIYGARVLGADEWGIFSYATTLAAFFSLFMDPGVNAILTRESSKATEEERRTYFSTIFVIKIFLVLGGVLFILFVAPFFTTLPGAKLLIPIAALIIFFDTTREFVSAFLRSMEKMEWETGIFIFTNIAIVVFGFVFLTMSPNAKSFGWAYVAGSAAGAIVSLIVIRKYFKSVMSYVSRKLIKPIFRSAWPFAITGALGLLLTNADILIISWMRSAAEVGVYSAAIRIIQVLYLVPTIIQFSTLPLFARLANKDNPKFRLAFEQVLATIYLASIPLALGGAILGTQVMTLVYGPGFLSGALSFRILMLTMIVDFPAMVISNAIFAYDHQRSLIISSAIAGTLNVALDLLLIPRWGINGSALATLIAQVASNAYLWYAMKRINHFAVFPRLKNIMAAGALMALGSIVMLVTGVNVIVNVLISMLFYFLLLKMMQEPILADVRKILGLGRDPALEGV